MLPCQYHIPDGKHDKNPTGHALVGCTPGHLRVDSKRQVWRVSALDHQCATWMNHVGHASLPLCTSDKCEHIATQCSNGMPEWADGWIHDESINSWKVSIRATNPFNYQHNITLDRVFWFSIHGCRLNLDEVLFWWMPNLLLHLCRWTWKSRQCWPRLTGWWNGDQFMLATCMHYMTKVQLVLHIAYMYIYYMT